MSATLAPGLRSLAVSPERSQLPDGVQDRLLVEAVRRRQSEAALSACFARWGYQEVIPPSFEYYENLAVGAGSALQQAMYRFFDRRGRTLALRADFTPQVARLAATKLFDQPMPLRCFYVGSLFRYEEPQAGRTCEFTQAGVELVGADTPAADAEIVALAIAALEALKLDEFQINLGQMAFFQTLAEGLPPAVLDPIREAVDQKNGVRLVEALDRAGLSGRRHDLLRRLPDLVGGSEVLDEARSLSSQLAQAARASAALERLAQVYQLLRRYGMASRVILDLSEVRGMDYYTGITLRGVAHGLGWPLVSGGRYDDLIAQFGRPMAAVGFGLGIERALLVQRRRATPSPAAHVLVHCCDQPGCLALVQRLRQDGCRVETDVLDIDEAGLAEHARRRGVPRTLRCAGTAWLLTEGSGERTLSEAALLQEAQGWKSQPDVTE